MQPKSAAQFFIPPGVKFWAGENWRDGDDQEDTVVIRIGAMFDLREARGNGTEGYMKCGGGGVGHWEEWWSQCWLPAHWLKHMCLGRCGLWNYSIPCDVAWLQLRFVHEPLFFFFFLRYNFFFKCARAWFSVSPIDLKLFNSFFIFYLCSV